MSDDPDNLVLLLLRDLRGDVASLTAEVRVGLTSVESRLGRVEMAVSELHGAYASVSVRIDQLAADIRQLKSKQDAVT